MKILSNIRDGFSHWIDLVASVIAAQINRLSNQSLIRLIENETGEFDLKVDGPSSGENPTTQPIRITDGQFDTASSTALSAILPGSRVELILHGRHFVFRQIELPDRAGDFLDGVVRAQIDRLTPWNATDAAFGWSQPIEISAGRMVVTVAATAVTFVKPYLQAITGFGVNAIAVLTHSSERPADALIRVWEESAREALDLRRIRKVLISGLAGAGLAAAIAAGVFTISGDYLDAQHDELSRQIKAARTQLGMKQAADTNSTANARRILGQHKNDAVAAVQILDTLSQILPDHTYVTELRIEDQKLHIVGVTRDAPSLIGLIEQSGRFARATFFAPTTRAQSDTLERFHIEAVIRPPAGSQS